MIPKDQWEWFGNNGHLIVGHDCRFHLCTVVGKYLISTVGQYWPDRIVREIHAQVHDPKWLDKNRHRKGDDFDAAYTDQFGFHEIGFQRKFETMVFTAGEPCQSEECNCGMPNITGEELDSNGYNTARDATKGHMEMCEKWADK